MLRTLYLVTCFNLWTFFSSWTVMWLRGLSSRWRQHSQLFPHLYQLKKSMRFQPKKLWLDFFGKMNTSFYPLKYTVFHTLYNEHDLWESNSESGQCVNNLINSLVAWQTNYHCFAVNFRWIMKLLWYPGLTWLTCSHWDAQGPAGPSAPRTELRLSSQTTLSVPAARFCEYLPNEHSYTYT